MIAFLIDLYLCVVLFVIFLNFYLDINIVFLVFVKVEFFFCLLFLLINSIFRNDSVYKNNIPVSSHSLVL